MQPQFKQDIIEPTILWELGQFDMHSSPQSRTQVGRAGEDKAKVLIPHEFVSCRMRRYRPTHTHITCTHNTLTHTHTHTSTPCTHTHTPLDLISSSTAFNPLQNRVNTSRILPPFCMLITRVWSSSLTYAIEQEKHHRWHCGGQTVTHPDEESLVIIVPNAPSIRPVPGHAWCKQKWRDRLVKEEVVINELLLLLLCHPLQWVVFAWGKRWFQHGSAWYSTSLTFELSTQRSECFRNNLFHWSPFCSSAVRWQAITTNGAPGTHTRWEDVVRVEIISSFEVLWV